jgi:hypothetical protein
MISQGIGIPGIEVEGIDKKMAWKKTLRGLNYFFLFFSCVTCMP